MGMPVGDEHQVLGREEILTGSNWRIKWVLAGWAATTSNRSSGPRHDRVSLWRKIKKFGLE